MFRIYGKRFEAGEVTLGGNTNNPRSDSGRGFYLVIFDRTLLAPSSERAATIEDVLGCMSAADPEKGRELFLHPRGAGCYKCHSMEGRGAKLAPDLSDIAARVRSARVLVESILEPSKAITEGFAQQQVATTDGKVFSGAVVEETGRVLKLADSNARLTTVPKSKVERRVSVNRSPMPDGFGRLLTAQQVADVVAWLQTQTVVGDRDGFSFRDRPRRLEIFFRNQRIATFLKEHDRLTRRALVNVTTLGGVPVTRHFPPRIPEDLDPGYRGENGVIHPMMHPGLWLGFGDLNGADFWRLKAHARWEGFAEPPTGDRVRGGFAVVNRMMNEEGDREICRETTRYRFEQQGEGLLIAITAEYRSDDHDFYFGDQEESGLAVRVASSLRVTGGGGTIVNDRGERNGAEVWGKQARWVDYSGPVQDQHVGVMIVPSPNNPRPSWMHVRDYGVAVVNPFPKATARAARALRKDVGAQGRDLSTGVRRADSRVS